MKKSFIVYTLFSAFILFTLRSNATATKIQLQYSITDSSISTDTIRKLGLTLIYINEDAGFADSVKQKLIDVFFKIYPQEMTLYNPQASKTVTFIIDTAYKGVAATTADVVHYNPEWFRKNPNDIDVVTHEVMHIVQAYPNNENAPWWVTEGIADYVRFTLGVYNIESNWKVPDYKPSQNYSNGYRVTARFFYWLEHNKKQGIIQRLDNSMRTKTFTNDFWANETGETIDKLWEEYGKNPSINQ